MNLKRLIFDFVFLVSAGTAIGIIIGLIFYLGGLLTGFLNSRQLKMIIPLWTIGGFIIGLGVFIDKVIHKR
jgi:hypothetical protein